MGIWKSLWNALFGAPTPEVVSDAPANTVVDDFSSNGTCVCDTSTAELPEVVIIKTTETDNQNGEPLESSVSFNEVVPPAEVVAASETVAPVADAPKPKAKKSQKKKEVTAPEVVEEKPVKVAKKSKKSAKVSIIEGAPLKLDYEAPKPKKKKGK